MAEGDLILYTTDDGLSRIQLREENGSVWLSQAEIAELFQATKQNISLHIRNIMKDEELQALAVVKDYLTTASDGKRYQTKHYSLPMILAVGYRVRSPRGIQFRRWATTVLSEYLLKGFIMDDERLKEPGWDYFDELLERIRDIRASEKRFYQKVRDLFAQSSTDYESASDTATTFFQTIQNKMLYAVTHLTAAELITTRADGTAANMGLTSWKGNRVRKGDITVSKNYLAESEAQELNRLTTMFLDFAEDRAERRQQITMAEWVVQTDRFLTFNEREVLMGAGQVSHQKMIEVTNERYNKFETRRKAAERNEAEQEHAKETLKAIERAHKEINGRKNDE